MFVRFESDGVKCSFPIKNGTFEYADSRDTLPLPYTGKSLHLGETVAALKIGLPGDMTVILIEPRTSHG